jgi:hypothetical protein
MRATCNSVRYWNHEQVYTLTCSFYHTSCTIQNMLISEQIYTNCNSHYRVRRRYIRVCLHNELVMSCKYPLNNSSYVFNIASAFWPLLCQTGSHNMFSHFKSLRGQHSSSGPLWTPKKRPPVRDVVAVFWTLTPCGSVGRHRRFTGTYFILNVIETDEDGRTKLFEINHTYLPNNTASHPARKWPSSEEVTTTTVLH